MLFAAVTHKLKLHQIDLASLRCECASNRATSVDTPNALVTGVTRDHERLIGVGLYLQLREALQSCAANRFVERGNPAEHLAPTGIHYSSLYIHALVRIRCAPDRKLYWVAPDAFMMTLACCASTATLFWRSWIPSLSKLGEESLTLDLHPGNIRIRLNISSDVFFMNTPCTLLKNTCRQTRVSQEQTKSPVSFCT